MDTKLSESKLTRFTIVFRGFATADVDKDERMTGQGERDCRERHPCFQCIETSFSDRRNYK